MKDHEDLTSSADPGLDAHSKAECASSRETDRPRLPGGGTSLRLSNSRLTHDCFHLAQVCPVQRERALPFRIALKAASYYSPPNGRFVGNGYMYHNLNEHYIV